MYEGRFDLLDNVLHVDVNRLHSANECLKYLI